MRRQGRAWGFYIVTAVFLGLLYWMGSRGLRGVQLIGQGNYIEGSMYLLSGPFIGLLLIMIAVLLIALASKK